MRGLGSDVDGDFGGRSERGRVLERRSVCRRSKNPTRKSGLIGEANVLLKTG